MLFVLRFGICVICILYFTGSLQQGERPTCLAGGAFLVAGELGRARPAYKWDAPPFGSCAAVTHTQMQISLVTYHKCVTIGSLAPCSLKANDNIKIEGSKLDLLFEELGEN